MCTSLQSLFAHFKTYGIIIIMTCHCYSQSVVYYHRGSFLYDTTLQNLNMSEQQLLMSLYNRKVKLTAGTLDIRVFTNTDKEDK